MNLSAHKKLIQCHKCSLKYENEPDFCKCGYNKFIEKWIYDINAILSYDAFMNLIIGVRRVGKTFAVGEYCVKKWLENKERFIWIRRWKTELGKALDCFSKLGYLHDTKGVYEEIENEKKVVNSNGKEKIKIVKERNYICEVITISTASRFRGFENNDFHTIVFDEYADEANFGDMSKEQILLDSLIVTILDEKKFAKVFILSNAVNKYLPLFKRAKINWEEEWTYNLEADIITHLVTHKDFNFQGASKKYLKSSEYFDYAFNNKPLYYDNDYLVNIDLTLLKPKYIITINLVNYSIYELDDKIIIESEYKLNTSGEILDKISEIYYNENQNFIVKSWLINKYKQKKVLFTNPNTKKYFFDWIKDRYN